MLYTRPGVSASTCKPSWLRTVALGSSRSASRTRIAYASIARCSMSARLAHRNAVTSLLVARCPVAPVHHLPGPPARRPARHHPKQLRAEVRARFVKVAEYQARGIVHYHAVIRLDAPGDSYQPPPLRYDTALLTAAIQATAAAISCDTVVLLARMLWRAAGANPVDSLPVIDPGLGRILRFGTQIDTRRYPPRPWRAAGHWDSAVSTGGRELHRQIRHQDHRRARTPPPAPFGSRCHRQAARQQPSQAADHYLLGTR